MVHATVEHGPTGWGGIATAVDLAAAGTAELGMDTLVMRPGSHDAIVSTPSGYRVRTVSGIAGAEAIYDVPDRPSLGRRLSRAMFDALATDRGGSQVRLLVHGDELAALLALAGGAGWCDAHSVFSHGLAQLEHPGNAALELQQEQAFQRADTVFVASENQRVLARQMFPGIHFQYLPLPLSVLDRQLSAFRRKSREREPGRLVAAGRAVAQKGADILLEAISLLPDDSGVDLRIFLGHGDRRIEARCSSIANALGDRVVVSGWQSRGDLLHEMAVAAAVVVPSRFEPLGLVAAEALALRTPVVATDVGGLAELVGEVPGTILVHAVGNNGPRSQDLANALSRMLSVRPHDVDGPSHLATYSLDRFAAALIPGAVG